MLEDGLVDLIKNDPAVAELSPIGGFMAELPKDFSRLTWSYTPVSDTPDDMLAGPGGLGMVRIQIDCCGIGRDALKLCKAIDSKLRGYSGTLSDLDQTLIDNIKRSDRRVSYYPTFKSYQVMLEYEVRLTF
jgi:hypothetical protein